jgi:hypothetical protein
LDIDVVEASLVIENQLLREELPSAVEVAVVDLIEILAKVRELHIEEAVFAVVILSFD